MNDHQLLRYQRHILLPDFGIDGQEHLLAATALIVGLGGIGSAAAIYLTTAGIGTLLLADHDNVAIDNLQRQILYRENDIGTKKTVAAERTLHSLNAETDLVPIHTHLNQQSMQQWVKRADVVLDASDNFATRCAINAVCCQEKKPLVSAAAIHHGGQLTMFDFRTSHSPCYRCLYPELPSDNGSCAENGVLAPIVGIMGTMQALETVKIIARYGTPTVGTVWVFEGKQMRWTSFRLTKDAHCPLCG